MEPILEPIVIVVNVTLALNMLAGIDVFGIEPLIDTTVPIFVLNALTLTVIGLGGSIIFVNAVQPLKALAGIGVPVEGTLDPKITFVI